MEPTQTAGRDRTRLTAANGERGPRLKGRGPWPFWRLRGTRQGGGRGRGYLDLGMLKSSHGCVRAALRVAGAAGSLASRSPLLTAGVLAVGVLVMGAIAQQPGFGEEGAEPLRPPVPGKPDEPMLIMNYLIMVVIIAVVVGANLIPSKRGHQD
jgi:hypothetical protein